MPESEASSVFPEVNLAASDSKLASQSRTTLMRANFDEPSLCRLSTRSPLP
jgi:hypothetical protein